MASGEDIRKSVRVRLRGSVLAHLLVDPPEFRVPEGRTGVLGEGVIGAQIKDGSDSSEGRLSYMYVSPASEPP